jgi:hypothetical protein
MDGHERHPVATPHRPASVRAEVEAVGFVDGEEKGWLKSIERLTGVALTPTPLPPQFDELRSKLPKPVITRNAPNGRGGTRSDAPTTLLLPDMNQNDQILL